MSNWRAALAFFAWLGSGSSPEDFLLTAVWLAAMDFCCSTDSVSVSTAFLLRAALASVGDPCESLGAEEAGKLADLHINYVNNELTPKCISCQAVLLFWKTSMKNKEIFQ